MKKFLGQLFNDSNSINEKSFIGFCAFLMMVIFAVSAIDKYINKKGDNKE
jgi:hypothetical protein